MQGHPAVHPLELEGQGMPAAQQPAAGAVPAPPVDFPELEGTLLGLSLRSVQVAAAITGLAFLFSPETFAPEFRLLALAALVQFFWSIVLWVLNLYACLAMRPLRNKWMLFFIAVVDGITTILNYVAAWNSAATVILLAYDLNLCGINSCPNYIGATAAGFVNATAVLPCFILTLWGYLRT